jgi:hypothetical protein
MKAVILHNAMPCIKPLIIKKSNKYNNKLLIIKELKAITLLSLLVFLELYFLK